MKINKLLYLSLLPLAIGSCQTLEETYGDYEGLGVVRYVGMCEDLNVEAGWNKLRATWTNSEDPNITGVKVAWTVSGVESDTLLYAKDGDIESVEIPELPLNENIKVSVRAFDQDGNLSLDQFEYQRPYNLSHEAVTTFTTMVDRAYFIAGNLYIYFKEWNEGIEELYISYNDGETMTFDKNLVDGKYLMIENVDETKEVFITRSGRIDGCVDVIPFPNFVVSTAPSFTSDFRILLFQKYGTYDINEAFCDKVTELDIDGDISDIRDILNFPNLKTLRLGANRFMLNGTDAKYMSNLYAENGGKDSDYAIEVFKSLDNGFAVERYMSHYNTLTSIDTVEEYGTADMEAKSYIASSKWTIETSLPTTGTIKPNHDLMFDGDMNTKWLPIQSSSKRTINITLTSANGEAIDVTGIDFAQIIPDATQEAEFFLLVPFVKVEYCVNSSKIWKEFNYNSTVGLGVSPGEKSRIYAKDGEAVKAFAIRLTVTDNYITTDAYNVSLAEVSLF